MSLSLERKAEIKAALDEIFGPPPKPRLKAVTREGAVIRDADVLVSRSDPNAQGADQVVAVRREDWVAIDMPRAMEQWEARQAEREERRRMRKADPLGIWGPYDDDE